MSNEFLRITNAPMLNACNIFRYSGTRLSVPENIAEHTYETMMIGYMIIYSINNIKPNTIDIGVFLEKALNHDMEECLTGDVARPLKYHNKDVKQELDIVASEVALKMYTEYFDKSVYTDHWLNSKSGIEGLIVKIADMLTVAYKALKEVCIQGNLYMLRVVHEVESYLHGTILYLQECSSGLDLPVGVLEYLEELLTDTVLEMRDIMVAYQDSLKYGMVSKSILGENGELV